MANQILSRLTRTLSTYFRIGTIRIKDSSGVVQMRDSGDTAYADAAVKQVRVQGTNATNAIVLNAPGSLGASVTFTLPSAVGSTNQVLADTGGDGTLGFIDVSANAALVATEAFTEGTSSPLTIFTPPDNSVISKVIVEVETAAGGSAPTISIGVSGTPEAYMAEAENDLTALGVYQIEEPYELGVSPSAVIATITPDSQTFSGRVYIHYVTPS